MRFGVFVPPQAAQGKVPVLTFLAGLTCSEKTFAIKAGAQRIAAELGLMLVTSDTSPRGAGIAGEDDDWDFGSSAGFYLDATEAPWSTSYNMCTYVTQELQLTVVQNFPVDAARQGIFGHSMGGHGALTLHLKNPGLYKSVSAFAPIAAPTQCPWGQKAFQNYLGKDQEAWRASDASELVRAQPSSAMLLIDQGTEDQFLDEQLKPQLLEEACNDAGQDLRLQMRPGYDHSYYFVQTFVEEHLNHHAQTLRSF